MSDRLPAPELPPGREIRLPGRGTTFIRDMPGPPGAPTLLLLHGFFANADLNWFLTYPQLRGRYRVIAMDIRGHGRGIRSRDRLDLADCADDAAAVIEALGIDRVTAVGYSMGGAIAQLLWKRHRHLVEGLVFCATAPCFNDSPRMKAAFRIVDGLVAAARCVPGSLVRRLARLKPAQPDADRTNILHWGLAELAQSDPRMLFEAMRAIGRFSSREWIGTVDVPTSIVVTRLDGLVTPDRQLEFAAAISNTTVHHVEADHTACASAHRIFGRALVKACADVTTSPRLSLVA
jgi:pimeloyl-ACP methyl ester carboxylesterase